MLSVQTKGVHRELAAFRGNFVQFLRKDVRLTEARLLSKSRTKSCMPRSKPSAPPRDTRHVMAQVLAAALFAGLSGLASAIAQLV